jgi:hypothetical protein
VLCVLLLFVGGRGKLKWQATQTPHKQKQNTQHRKLKWHGRVGVCVPCHFSFLCCVFCFCLWEVGRVGVRVACFLFVGVCVAWHFSFLQKNKNDNNTDSPQTKTKHTTQQTKMISNTDHQQIKTKHTTQKTKMISNRDLPQTKKNTQHLCCLSF